MKTSSLFMTAGGRHVSKGHARAGPIAFVPPHAVEWRPQVRAHILRSASGATGRLYL